MLRSALIVVCLACAGPALCVPHVTASLTEPRDTGTPLRGTIVSGGAVPFPGAFVTNDGLLRDMPDIPDKNICERMRDAELPHSSEPLQNTARILSQLRTLGLCG